MCSTFVSPSRRTAIVLALAVVCVPALGAPPFSSGEGQSDIAKMLSTPLTLENAVRIALANQQTIRIANSQLQVARAQVVQATSTYYPQITPTYQYINQKAVLPAANGGPTVSETQTSGIAAQQLIFDSGKRDNNVAQTRYSARAAQATALDTRQSVIVAVTTDFYIVLEDKELVRVAQANADDSKTTLDAVRAEVQAGAARKIDIYQAEADYANALVALSQARTNVRVALVTLRNAMGITVPLEIVTNDTPPPTPSLTPDTKPLTEYLATAYAARLDLKSNEQTVGAQRMGLNLARIAAGPQVQADFSVGYQVQPTSGDDRTFMTTFTYPLFDGGAAAAGVRAAKAAVDQARDQVELTRQAIQLDVETYLDSREEARQRIGAANTALNAARTNYAAAQDSFREGASSILDVIQAQTALVTAETNAVQALYDFYTADAQLKRAIGQNDPYRAENSKL